QPVLDAAIELSRTKVAAGADLSVIGSSFGAGESASITLHSDPVSLGKVQANDAGECKTSVTVPADTAPGEHEVVVTGADSGTAASAALIIIAPVGGGGGVADDGAADDGGGGAMPVTGIQGLGLLLVAALFLGIGAVTLGLVRLRRRTR